MGIRIFVEGGSLKELIIEIKIERLSSSFLMRVG